MWTFIILAVDVIIVYMIVPFVITRILGWGAVSRGEAEKAVSFTFDDGPDPCYTPELLDLLLEYDVKATFFVLGKKAEQNPDLIRRMHREGHQIGIHNYTHTPNWIYLPWTIRRKQVNRTADIIERITGERPILYRPPWGLLNVGDLIGLRRAYRIVLWSVMVGDWKTSVSSKQLKYDLLEKIKPGSIIVLHDNGDTLGADREAPLNMITGLEEVLRDVHLQGLRCLRVDELLLKEAESVGKAQSRANVAISSTRS